MRWLLPGAITAWLIVLSLGVWLIQFNKYGDPSIIDCDTDAELVFMLFLVLIWLTMLFIWGINLILKDWNKTRFFWFLGGFSMTCSIAFIPKLIEWINYNAELSKICQ